MPPGGLESALGPLPVESLRLPIDVLHVLARLGVVTIDQLRQLSRGALAERFGSQIALRLDQAFGNAPEAIVPHHPAPTFDAAFRLEIPTDRRDVLDWLVAGLVERIAAQLRARGVGAVRLVGRIDCGPGDPVNFAVGLFRPADSPQQLRELLRLHWERLSLPGPVERIRLWADQTAPLRPQQSELFTDQSRTAEQLAGLLERLSSRLGPRAVVRPKPHPDPLPERAVRYLPLIGKDKGRRMKDEKRKKKGAKAMGSDSSFILHPSSLFNRPLRLITPPVRVSAMAVVPDGPPVSFRWQGRQHMIARHWGPERIETGWWRSGTVRRDYYRVETAAGNRFWLFRNLDTGAWHVHGSFE